jgi:protein O-mannosyl-transferase
MPWWIGSMGPTCRTSSRILCQSRRCWALSRHRRFCAQTLLCWEGDQVEFNASLASGGNISDHLGVSVPFAHEPGRPGGAPRMGWLPIHWLAVVAVVVAADGIVLLNGFVSWDDPYTIARNFRIVPATIAGLLACWRTPQMHLWAPVTYTAWWLVSAAIGLTGASSIPPVAWPFHLASLIAHAAASLAVLSLLNRIVRDSGAALVGALVFAAHPLQVEAVAWASGLKDVLCGLFVLAALRAYVVAGDRGRSKRWGWWALSTVLVAAAMLSKPTAIVAPLLAIGLDRALLGRTWGRTIGWALPWVVLAVPIAWIGAKVQPPVFRPETVAVSGLDRMVVAEDAVAFYLRKLVVPWPMGVDYGHRPDLVLANRSARLAWAMPLAIVLTCAAALVMFGRRRSGRAEAALVGLLFCAPLAPVLGFVPFDFQQYSTVADHYLYLPMAGVALMIAAVVARWDRIVTERAIGRAGRLTGGAMNVAIGVLITGMVVASVAQERTWRNSQSLFDQALKANPTSWAAFNSLAAYAIDRGDYSQARTWAERAATLAPMAAGPQITLGVARARLNDEPGALEAYRRAVALEPANPVARVNLGGLLAKLGQGREAAEQLTQAVRLDGENADARLNLGALLDLAGRPQDAARELSVAVQLAPGNSKAHANLGIVLAELNHREAALRELREALRLDPANDEARQAIKSLAGSP